LTFSYTLEYLLAVHIALDVVQGLAEALEVHHFPLPQELQPVLQVDVVCQLDQVLVGHPGLLLCRHILVQVGDGVAHGVDVGGAKRDAVAVAGEDAAVPDGVVSPSACRFDLRNGCALGQLEDHGGDHLPVSELLGADVGQHALAAAGGHGVALGEIANCGAQFAIGAAQLPVLYNEIIVPNRLSS